MPLLVIVLTLLCHISTAAAQPPSADDSAYLRGRIVAEHDGTPVAGARAVVVVDSAATGSTYSDRDGYFRVVVPARGSWRLSITKAGFAPAIHPAAAAAGEPVVVGLLPGAAVTGRVLDEHGDPLPAGLVRVRRVCRPECETGIAMPATFIVQTDDRGVYRLGSLPAGPYAVELVSSAVARTADVAVALPGAGTALVSPGNDAARGADAQPAGITVELRAGEDAVVHLARAEPSRLPRPEASAGSAVRTVGAIIRGRITAATGRAVAGVGVQAGSVDGTTQRGGTTDAEGRYEIFGLSAGTYQVTVTRTGLEPVAYGQQHARQPGIPVSLAAGEVLEGIDLRLPPAGVVTGRVVDVFGGPLEGMTVQVWERRVRAGGSLLAAVTRGLTTARTDDRGSYRVHGLLPGTYYVSATDAAGGTALNPELLALLDRSVLPVEHAAVSVAGLLPPRAPVHVFYPAAVLVAQATPVRIDPGIDLQGVDITFAPAPAARIDGAAVDSTGGPAQGTARLLVSHRSGAPVPPARSVTLGAGGRFAFDEVPAGEYVVHVTTNADVDIGGPLPTEQAFERMQAATNEFGMEYLTVTGTNDMTVAVRTSPRALVFARVVAEGGGPSIDAHAFDVSLESADLDRAPDPVGLRRRRADPWTFERQNVTGPMRFQLRRAPPGWYLESALVGGIDAAEHPFTFTSADREAVHAELVVARGGDIAGGAVGARDQPVADYFVVAFATDPTRWFFGSPSLALVRGGRDGRFTIDGLPTGEYWLAAVDRISGDETSLEWQSSEALSRLIPGARRVRVGRGERVAVELRLVQMPGQ